MLDFAFDLIVLLCVLTWCLFVLIIMFCYIDCEFAFAGLLFVCYLFAFVR